MKYLPAIFNLHIALQVLADNTDVLPAVGGATEDELRPDADEIDDQETTKDDALLDEPYEFGSAQTYVALTPLRRTQEHIFRFFQDGSMRSFFIGTVLEHDRQTPVIIGQVGCAALKREDTGQLKVVTHEQRNLMMLAFSQVSDEVRTLLGKAIESLGGTFQLANIEDRGRPEQDLRSRAQDTMRSEMTKLEAVVLKSVVELGGDDGIIRDGSIRIAQFDELTKAYRGRRPIIVGVSKSFSKNPRFKVGRGCKSKEVNIWQLLADLPEGNRTLAFRAMTAGRTVAVWYIRLRVKGLMEYPLMGVIKVELPILNGEPPASEFVTMLSNALLAERTVTPYGADRRWHAHLYPIFQAERCAKNAFVSMSILKAGLRWPPAMPRR